MVSVCNDESDTLKSLTDWEGISSSRSPTAMLLKASWFETLRRCTLFRTVSQRTRASIGRHALPGDRRYMRSRRLVHEAFGRRLVFDHGTDVGEIGKQVGRDQRDVGGVSRGQPHTRRGEFCRQNPPPVGCSPCSPAASRQFVLTSVHAPRSPAKWCSRGRPRRAARRDRRPSPRRGGRGSCCPRP